MCAAARRRAEADHVREKGDRPIVAIAHDMMPSDPNTQYGQHFTELAEVESAAVRRANNKNSGAKTAPASCHR